MAAIKTEDERAATPSFVGLCPECNGLIACAVDEPLYAKENSKSVAEWMRSGLKIEKRSVAEVRIMDWCKGKKKKGSTSRHSEELK